MMRSRQRVRIFLAAIVLAALQFVPAVSEAHVGHVYGHSHSTEARHVPATAIHTVIANTVAVKTAPPRDVVPETVCVSSAEEIQSIAEPEFVVTATLNSVGSRADSDAHSGGCCCDGMICCGAAFTSAPADMTPVARSIRVRLVSHVQTRGSTPEALRKPPRDLV